MRRGKKGKEGKEAGIPNITSQFTLESAIRNHVLKPVVVAHNFNPSTWEA